MAGVHEAIEGVLNMVCLEHHLRNYNFGPLVILRDVCTKVVSTPSCNVQGLPHREVVLRSVRVREEPEGGDLLRGKPAIEVSK